MAKIYISYARDDQMFAIWLSDKLINAGHRIWFDISDIGQGADWGKAIQRGLEYAELMVLIISPKAVDSSLVMQEATYFRSNNKPIIPVLYEPAKLPFYLHRLQYVDFSQAEWENAFPSLLEAIEAHNFRLTPEEARAQQQQIAESLRRSREALDQSLPRQRMPASELNERAKDHVRRGATKDAIHDYLQVLRDPQDPGLRVVALKALSALKATAAIPNVTELLHHDSAPVVRKEAVKMLATMHSPIVDRALEIAMVSDENLEVRLFAGLVQRHFRHPNTVMPWLNRLAGSHNEELRGIISEAQLYANELSRQGGHVFISYARDDAEAFVLELVDTLRTQYNYRVWIDTNLKPGDVLWQRSIEKAIQQCDLVLLVLSPGVHDSIWIPREINFAEQFGKERLYVRYRPTYVPLSMTGSQSLREDLTFEDYPEEMLAALVEEFERRQIPKIDIYESEGAL